MPKACAIDFGTSNSAIGCFEKGGVRLANFEGEGQVVPTAIFYENETKEAVFGNQAIRSYTEGYPGRFMRSIKTILSSDLYEQGTYIWGKTTSFRRIIVDYIKFLRQGYSRDIGPVPDTVVCGRPVFFIDNDSERDVLAETRLREALLLSGFKNVHFQYEPVAAAFDYVSRNKDKEIVLVFDIGGGTSDFSLIKVAPNSKEQFSIIASSGTRIGGNDFDARLSLMSVMPELGLGSRYGSKRLEMPLGYYINLATWHSIQSLYSHRVIRELQHDILPYSEAKQKIERLIKVLEGHYGHRVLGLVEKAKIDLSSAVNSQIFLPFIEKDFSVNVERSVFERAVDEPLVQKILAKANVMIKQTDVANKDIDAVYMTGGSSYIPLLQNSVRSSFPKAEIVIEDCISSVAKGLAISSAKEWC